MHDELLIHDSSVTISSWFLHLLEFRLELERVGSSRTCDTVG